jgi:hypothetical protein
VEIPEPTGTYFLIAQVQPKVAEWHLSGVYRASNRAWDSVRLSSEVPEELIDTQMWCSRWYRVQPINRLDLETAGVDWTLMLVEGGTGEPLSDHTLEALSGYYGVCPPEPPEESLRVIDSWSSQDLGANTDIEYTTLVPFTYLLLKFQPDSKEWGFESVDRSENWSRLGPSVSSDSSATLSTSSLCPEVASLHTLEVESSGGEWRVWLVGVPETQ